MSSHPVLPIAFAPTPLSAAAWEAVPAEKTLSGAPKAAHQLLYSSSDGTFHAGTYECTAGKWTVSYAEEEFCALLEGRVTLTDGAGNACTFAAPDCFLIPAGFSGTWEAHGHVRKHFVIYEKRG